jgi:glycine cleavage system H protein
MATEFDEGRCWFRKQGKLIVLGLTNAALQELGEVERVHLPGEGDYVEEGDVICEVEGTQSTLEVIAPKAGTIALVNEGLTNSPETLAEDPLDEGWVCKIAEEGFVEDESSDQEESS